jgi:hypothetical protein
MPDEELKDEELDEKEPGVDDLESSLDDDLGDIGEGIPEGEDDPDAEEEEEGEEEAY